MSTYLGNPSLSTAVKERVSSTFQQALEIANTIEDARALTRACREAKVVLALGYQRRRESHFRQIRTTYQRNRDRATELPVIP